VTKSIHRYSFEPLRNELEENFVKIDLKINSIQKIGNTK